MELTTVILAGLATLTMAQAVLLWRATRAVARLATIDTRIEKFGDALTLLTDTTESAFRAVAAEVSRQPAVAPKRAAAVSAARTRRIARAVKGGASVQQVAASEQVSEGEVRLRVHVAEDGRKPRVKTATRARKAREGRRAAVRLD